MQVAKNVGEIVWVHSDYFDILSTCGTVISYLFFSSD